MNALHSSIAPHADHEVDAWRQALREGVYTGTVASLLSTAALLVAGLRQNRSAWAPVNAASHWLWGDESLRRDGFTWRHTGLGYLTQHAASIFWATVYARVRGQPTQATAWPQAIAGSAATFAAAAAIDYSVVPRRLRPGYEHRLSTGAMVGVFAALAAGLALGTVALRNR